MIIICDNNKHIVLAVGKQLEYMCNGYIILTDQNISFPPELIDINNVDVLPDDIIINKYCYTTDDGFYENPNWVEPDPTNIYGIPDEVYHAIIDDYTEEIFGGES